MKLLKLLIRGSRLTQTQVAEQAGITEKHLSRLCTGRAGISEMTAQKIADVLGLPEEVLYTGLYLERLAIERGDLVEDEDDDDDTEDEPRLLPA